MKWDARGLDVLNRADQIASSKGDAYLRIDHLSAALNGEDAERAMCPTCGRPNPSQGMSVAVRKAFEQAHRFAVSEEAEDISTKHLRQALASAD